MAATSAGPFDVMTARLDALIASPDAALVASAPEHAAELLALGEAILENWLAAHDATPTSDTFEGFRLLALQRQGARGDAQLQCLPRDLPRARLSPQSGAARADARRTPRAGFVSPPWWRDTWRSSSAASLKWRGSASSVARRGRCGATTQTPSQPPSRDFKEDRCRPSEAANFPMICSTTWKTTSGTARTTTAP